MLSKLGLTAIIIELKYRPAVCNLSFCKPTPYIATRAGKHEPEKGFVRIQLNNINVFLHEPLSRLAADKKARISVEATGFWKWKRLTSKGLDPYLL